MNLYYKFKKRRAFEIKKSRCLDGHFLNEVGRNQMELKSICTFTETLQDCGPVKDSLSTVQRPKTEVGYYRADFDGHRWWTQYFTINDALRTESLVSESDGVWENLLNGFSTLSDLSRFCMEGNARRISDVEYECYVDGKLANYWIRFITLEKSYNIYCHILTKEFRD